MTDYLFLKIISDGKLKQNLKKVCLDSSKLRNNSTVPKFSPTFQGWITFQFTDWFLCMMICLLVVDRFIFPLKFPQVMNKRYQMCKRYLHYSISNKCFSTRIFLTFYYCQYLGARVWKIWLTLTSTSNI